MTGYSSDNERDQDTTNYSSSQHESEHSHTQQHIVVNGVVVDNFMASDNLNECVDFLLTKEKPKNLNVKAIIRHNTTSKCKDKRRRLRKNKDQHNILLAIYEKDPNWDKPMIKRLSDQLGLKES